MSIDKLLQAEAGVTRTEPTQLAVRQAIDLAVYATIMQGAQKGIWNFADQKGGRALLQSYLSKESVTATLLPAAEEIRELNNKHGARTLRSSIAAITTVLLQ